jgi:hypothetical protein
MISRGSGLGSRRYQIFWEVVGLERGPLNLMSTIEELLGRISRGSGLEIREYSRRDSSRWPRGTLCPQRLALTSPTSGGLSVCIVRSRTQATEFCFSLFVLGTCACISVGYFNCILLATSMRVRVFRSGQWDIQTGIWLPWCPNQIFRIHCNLLMTYPVYRPCTLWIYVV